jgi:hypothetical protein
MNIIMHFFISYQFHHLLIVKTQRHGTSFSPTGYFDQTNAASNQQGTHRLIQFVPNFNIHIYIGQKLKSTINVDAYT